jgi:hypothetical protein
MTNNGCCTNALAGDNSNHMRTRITTFIAFFIDTVKLQHFNTFGASIYTLALSLHPRF